MVNLKVKVKPKVSSVKLKVKASSIKQSSIKPFNIEKYKKKQTKKNIIAGLTALGLTGTAAAIAYILYKNKNKTKQRQINN
jgi:hypothetical protein